MLFVCLKENTRKLSPVTFVDGQTKDFLKGKLRENQLLIWRSCVEASIYCALFHETKKFLKARTANHRWVLHAPAVTHMCFISSITQQRMARGRHAECKSVACFQSCCSC